MFSTEVYDIKDICTQISVKTGFPTKQKHWLKDSYPQVPNMSRKTRL